MTDPLAQHVLDALAADPAALARLRELVGVSDATPNGSGAAATACRRC